MISIIVPAYNAQRTISECIDSLKKQTFKGKYEIIVVDDGSTDRTVEIVRKTGVKILRQRHEGPARARNLGAKKAKGDILVFTDADCITEKNWLEEIANPFKDKDIVGVQGAYKTKQKSLIARFSQIEIEDRYKRMKKHRYIDFVGTYSAAYRKDVFLKEGGFDTSFPIASGEDPEFSYRLARKGYKMVFNPRAIVYHNHPSTLYKYLKTKFYRAYYRIDMYRKHKEKTIKDTYTPQVLKIQILIIFLALSSLVASIFFHKLIIVSLGLFVLLFLSTIDFLVYSLRKDVIVGLISPWVIILRSFVFLVGLFMGLIRKFY